MISFSFELVAKMVVPEMVVSVAEKLVAEKLVSILVVLGSHSFSF